MTRDMEKIGYVYHPDYLIHTHSNHPERKERLEAIKRKLDQEEFQEITRHLEPDYARLEDITLVHDSSYVETVEKSCREDRGFLDMDTYIVPQSYEVALLSAGGALKGLEEIMEGDLNKVFCFIRPPGHHAERNKAMGFCLFNNIAIAAEKARKKYGVNRIAIVDWDVHHGNSTQNTFYQENEVLFISTHQSPAFPGTGYLDEIGRGKGEGYTINIPMTTGSGNGDYVKVFSEVIIPVLEEYRPQLLMVSAGHDAHGRDPLANMNLTEDGYFYMAGELARIADKHCQGRMLLTLEGGYNLEAQANSVGNVIKALSQKNGEQETPDTNISGNMTVNNIEKVRGYLGKYWDALK